MIEFFKERVVNISIYIFFQKVLSINKILRFILAKYLSIIFLVFQNWQKAAYYWIISVSSYIKKSNSFFNSEYDILLANILVRITQQIPIIISPYFQKKENVLYLVSGIVDSGGHTRVMVDFMEFHDKQRYNFYCYSTEIELSYDSRNSIYYNKIGDKVKELYRSEICYNEYYSKIEELIKFVEHNNIGTIISFDHAYDLVAIASLIKLKSATKLNLIYYHHHNTLLTLIPNICDSYIEISDYLLPYSKVHHNNVRFMEIPVKVDVSNDYSVKRERSDFVIMTAIPVHKMFFNSSLCFLELITYVLSEIPGIKFLIASNQMDLFYINMIVEYFRRRNLEDRIKIRNDVTKLNQLYFDYDLYLDSIPVGGGKTIIEMMALGKPCIIYEGDESLFDQNKSLEFIKVKNRKELILLITRLKNDSVYCKSFSSEFLSFVENTFNSKTLTAELESLIEV